MTTPTTIGVGICTTPWGRTISETKTPLSICSEGPQAVFELEHMGLPFSRTESGRIYQRPFGGQSKNLQRAAKLLEPALRPTELAMRCCTPYQANVKANTTFERVVRRGFGEELEDGVVVGVIALNIESGEVVACHSRAIVLATGGAGRDLCFDH